MFWGRTLSGISRIFTHVPSVQGWIFFVYKDERFKNKSIVSILLERYSHGKVNWKHSMEQMVGGGLGSLYAVRLQLG